MVDVARVMSGDDRTAAAHAMRAALRAAEPIYAGVMSLRNAAFERRWRRVTRLPRPTISVGNLTTGGTGKTPMVRRIAEKLRDWGQRPAILTRGYRGGDEAAELREALGEGVPVEANADRVAGAAAVLARRQDVSVFVLDDGFQHRKVARDVDLVLLDATNPWGFGHVLPRGMLREPVRGVRRASGVVVTRCELASTDAIATLDARVLALTGRRPIAHARSVWTAVRHADGQLPLATLRPLRVVGVSGIGNPQAMRRALESACAGVAEFLPFPDHHAYSPADLQRVAESVRRMDAQAIVMTEKDWVKWRGVPTSGDGLLPIYRPVLSLDVGDGEAALDALLRSVLTAPR